MKGRWPTKVPAGPRDRLDCTAAVCPWLDELNATLPDSAMSRHFDGEPN